MLPRVYLQVVNVRLRNAQGSSKADAIVVKSVDLDVGLRALLARKLDVTAIALTGVQVNLLRDPTGRTNLELPVPRALTRTHLRRWWGQRAADARSHRCGRGHERRDYRGG